MNKLIVLSFLLFSFSSYAQEMFLDSIFEVTEPTTEIYAIKDGEELSLDIYQPKNDTDGKRPLLVFMHGGGFSSGSPKNPDEVKFAEMAAARGYVAVQISYRLTRKGQSFGCDYEATGKLETFKHAAEDFMDAVKFLISQQAELKIDPEKIIVGGSSAGAEAVLNAVYNPDLIFSDSDDYKDINFTGVISLAGAIVDARYLNKENAVPGIFFHGTNDNLVPYATAPHHFCEKDQPGYLILDGSKTIAERLLELETSYLLVTVEGAGHEISGIPFDNLPLVFSFLKKVALEGEKHQTHIVK